MSLTNRLGGYLLSCLLNLLVLSIANIFFRLAIIDLVWLYGGLFLFCGFVLYDTHRTFTTQPCVIVPNLSAVIIEKAHQGSRDFVRHALELFLGTRTSYRIHALLTPSADFVNIFIRLLIILSRRRD